MITRTVLIERAARADYETDPRLSAVTGKFMHWDECVQEFPLYAEVVWFRVERVLDALVPPGEAWIAPMELTDDMAAARSTALHYGSWGYDQRHDERRLWAAMREAFLAQSDTDNGS